MIAVRITVGAFDNNKTTFRNTHDFIECAYNHIIFAIGLISCILPDSSHGIP